MLNYAMRLRKDRISFLRSMSLRPWSFSTRLYESDILDYLSFVLEHRGVRAETSPT